MIQKCLHVHCSNISLNDKYCFDHFRENLLPDDSSILRPICNTCNCHRALYAKGLCKSHYDKQLKHGDENYVSKKHVDKKCMIKDCTNRHFGLGYCAVHYRVFNRERKKKEIMELRAKRQGDKNDFPLQAIN